MAKFNIGEIVKKISLILILLLLFSITGCSKENAGNEMKNDDFITNDSNENHDASMAIGKIKSKGFIIDNVLYSKMQGDIHFASFYPDNYDENKEYAIYFALPGWGGLYFQGVGANLNESLPFEAQKYNDKMIIISPQLDDWGEESAKDTIELVEYFLNNYNIDKSRVYISGVSGGGETLSLVLEKRPELFTAALYFCSQWDGKYDKLIQAKTPLYMAIGENDSYYGSTKTKNAYNDMYKLYKDSGLTEEEIDKILVLDVKPHEYFTSKGYSDEHSGCNLFAYEEDIMNWVFSKVKM